MGEAIVKALNASKSSYKIYVSDKNATKAEQAAIEYGLESDLSYSALGSVDAIILAVKPQDLSGLAENVRDKISKQGILISIAAGTTIEKIRQLFGQNKVVRVMPNMGLMVGEGISAWTSSGLSESEKKKVQSLLNDLSENIEVNFEELIDAVTAVSGSGPAYFFLLAQALERSARSMGLSESEARLLVEKTLSAAAILQKGKSYEELIKSVASKGGTTEAALRVLEEKGFGKIIDEAVRASQSRSRELSHE